MLELYKNIKKYRIQQGITQQDLALKAGYKDKSMIAKIEKGLIDLPQSKILTFSEIFNVEPSELMGWRDYANASDGKGTTPLERFRDSIYFKEINKYSYITQGLELILEGLYDTVEEIDIEDITYYKLTRGDISYYIEFALLETLESRVSTHVRSLIKDFNNSSLSIRRNTELNAAHVRTDVPITNEDVQNDDEIMDDDNF